jgi:hypothetical protein
LHVGSRGAFVVGDDARTSQIGVRGVPAALIAEHSHHRWQPALDPGLGGKAIVEAEVGIAVEHEKPFAEQPAGCSDRPERADRRGSVVAVSDLEAESIGTNPLLDLLAQVADAEDDSPCAVRSE